MGFADLGLSDEVLKAIGDAGYEEPTPIQDQAVPYVLMGRDVLGCAQTGTGKTASFTLPMIDVLATGRTRARMPRSLILEPTRELAAQVAENFDVYGKYHRLEKALIIGGTSFSDQEKLLDRGVDVLIATPGRLLDMFERGGLLLNDVKILVIDEADRMLDMGFIPDVERIVSLMPRIRQTLLFSATLLPEIRRIADAFLLNPKEIHVTPPATAAEMVAQHLVVVDKRNKRKALRGIVESEDVKNALIFCNRKRDVSELYRSLQRHGFNAGALHGDMAQPARTETLNAFRTEKIRLLVCSDVAARGLDIESMSHVINFDVPMNAEDYIHRIGRTGRAGREGTALTIASSLDARSILDIERLLGHAIPRFDVEGVASVALGEATERGGRRRRTTKDRAAPAGERKLRGERKPPNESRPEREAKPLQARTDKTEGPSRPEPEGTKHTPKPKLEPRAEKAKRAPKPKPEPRAEKAKPERKPKKPAKPKKKGPVVGLGDHTPAFLLRPVRAAKIENP